MTLKFKPEEEAFRDKLRHAFQNDYPKAIRDKVAAGEELTRDETIASHKALAKIGYIAPGWPVEWGGVDLTPVERFILQDEMLENNIGPVAGSGISLLGPVLAEYGTKEQKERFLPATLNADIWWAQGFSEPGAGSDLAGLQTRAVLDGDHYVVNGQKIWTTMGHYGDWIFTLVRTNPDAPKKQMGISFLLIDMKTPGVTVRKIRLMDDAWEVNEVFFDNVIVPVEMRIGEENMGWTYAKFLLGNERGGSANAKPHWRELEHAKREAAKVKIGSGTLLEDPVFRARVAEIETHIVALEQTILRVVGSSTNGRPNPVGSILKLRGSEINQMLTLLLVDVAGPNARAFDNAGLSGVERWQSRSVHTYLNHRKVTIYAGSSEVQRGIIASNILGA